MSTLDVPDQIRRDVVAWRRHLHRNPEPSFHEEQTARFVRETLGSFPGVEVSRPTPTSVMGRLRGGQSGQVLAIRADMDALPIQEENDFEFASQRAGVMHACGHDAHTVTQFVAGTTHNVIPGAVEMQGTVRTFEPALRARIPELMERHVKGVTAAHGATYEFKYQHGYRVVVNESRVTGVVEDTVREVLGESAVETMKPNMGGEDFSAFQERAPGCFFFIGAGNAGKGIVHPHHHPRFTVDEDALALGVEVFVNADARLLSPQAREVGQ